MAKFLHKYKALSAFTEDYNGEAYHEPWVSYVNEVGNEEVDYNKREALNEITWSYEYGTIRVETLSLTCEDLDIANSGKTYQVKVNVANHPEGDYSFNGTMRYIEDLYGSYIWGIDETEIHCQCGDGTPWFYIPA